MATKPEEQGLDDGEGFAVPLPTPLPIPLPPKIHLIYTEILKMIRKDYPNVPSTSSTKVRVGFNMKELGFESYVHAHVTYYYAVPLKTA